MNFYRMLVSTLFCLAGLGSVPATPAAAEEVPSLAEVIKSGHDLWGEAAMRQPDGASYEFFAPLLPPLRFVNADFRNYPIELSAPRSPAKARLISNGSGLNLRGGAHSWHDVGTPVTFRVGPDEFLFGGLADRLSEPTLAEGYLPIVEIRYRHGFPVQAEGSVPLSQQPTKRELEIYRLEAFADTDPVAAANGVVLVKFSLAQGTTGLITACVDGEQTLRLESGKLIDAQGRIWAWFDDSWKMAGNRVRANLNADSVATMAVPIAPMPPGSAVAISPAEYEVQRRKCAETWRQVLAGGMSVDVPEPLVNNAWRNLLIQNFALLNGDRIFYSAGNQYEKLYESEGSDAALAMMAWGYEDEMRRMIGPLLEFTRKGLEFHQAGFKINDVCRFFWQTRDADFLRSIRDKWEPELKRIVDGRVPPYGLFPKEQYCGDIHTLVLSINANSKAWRAMHDLAAVLEDIGQHDQAASLAKIAAGYRKDVLDAIDKSVHREIDPPFVPLALLDEEPVHNPITATRIGSYWNIVIGFTIGSGIFPPGSEQETWIPRYLQTYGGLCMGMLRAGGSRHAFWTGSERSNPLYGTRYTLDLLRRDDVERTIVSFYGMLAQGLTRNTFIGGEGNSLQPVDEHGRFFYCPPNSAANGHLLTILRNMLVQDFDLDVDGRPDTLRLLFATPRRWLADGCHITVSKAPTAFGPVSVRASSNLAKGEVTAEVDLPQRNKPAKTLLRLRLPGPWRIVSATAGDRELTADATGTLDLSWASGHVAIRCKVADK